MTQKEINAGHTLLDQNLGKEWVYDIDISKLNMISSTEDLLGQLYGAYELGLTELRIEDGCIFGFIPYHKIVSGNFDKVGDRFSRLQQMQTDTITKLQRERSST